MPKIEANGITIHYEQEGSGEPLILIPFLSADHACYAFQVAEYAKHFTCISVDLRGSGESDKPEGVYSTELFADDLAALMAALGIPGAHISGLSLGAAVGMWLAIKHPQSVKSLSLHGGWVKSDAFQKLLVENWQIMARALGSMPETVIRAIFPWCFRPELYATQPDFIESLQAFVRSRPPQPVQAFLQQSNAVLAHNVESQLERITAPTLITVGSADVITPPRVAAALKEKIVNSELVVFEGCAHATCYEATGEFNRRTLDFLLRRAAAQAA